MTDVIIAGAGIAGLVAAVEARRCGASVRLLEKTERAGGCMRISSGVFWRHRDFEQFRRECPGGDRELQWQFWSRVDDDLEWLEALGVRPLERDTGNSLTTGVRFDVEELTAVLVEAAGEIEFETPLVELPTSGSLVLATGGFGASRELIARYITPYADSVLLRNTGASTGDGLALGQVAGGKLTVGMNEFYGRALPVTDRAIAPEQFIELAQLYGRYATITNSDGVQYRAQTWSEIDAVQWIAQQRGARATYSVSDDELNRKIGKRTVREMLKNATQAGAHTHRSVNQTEIAVTAGITTTLGGLAIDNQARVAPGAFACGNDAGAVATGGYASGLAAAVVFGRIAGKNAVGIHDR